MLEVRVTRSLDNRFRCFAFSVLYLVNYEVICMVFQSMIDSRLSCEGGFDESRNPGTKIQWLVYEKWRRVGKLVSFCVLFYVIIVRKGWPLPTDEPK